LANPGSAAGQTTLFVAVPDVERTPHCDAIV